MKILKNLFGKNTKIATSDIATIAGVPLDDLTIVDSGANANGSWIKFADGTMICRHKFSGVSPTLQEGAIRRSASVVWTYPQLFVGVRPEVSGFVEGGRAYSWIGAGDSASNVSQTSFVLLTGGGGEAAGSIGMLAIGRWK